jgi:hypothetical protein
MLVVAFALSISAAQLFTVKTGGNVLVRGEVPVQTYIAATGEVTWGEMQKVLASYRAMEKAQRLILVPATSPDANEPWAVFLTDTAPPGKTSVMLVKGTANGDVKTAYVNGEPVTIDELARAKNDTAKLAVLELDSSLPMSFVGDVAAALHKRGAVIVAVPCEACQLVDKLSPAERERAKGKERKIATDALSMLDVKGLVRAQTYGTTSGNFVGSPVQLPKAKGAAVRSGAEVISFTAKRELYTEQVLRLLPKDAEELAAFANKHCSQSRERKISPVLLEIDARASAADVVALVRAAAPAETFVIVKTPVGYGELALTIADGSADVVVGAKDTLQDIVTKIARSKVKDRAPSIALRR